MKYILLLLLLITLTGCGSKKDNLKAKKLDKIEDKMAVGNSSNYEDTNPIKVALYQNNKKVKEVTYKKANHVEIGTYNAFYTDKNQVENDSVKNNWYRYFKSYKDISEYKTGFYINFKAEGKEYEQTILDPTSKHKHTPYVLVYFYDSYNYKPGTVYSHLEMSDMKKNTVITSIKLYLAGRGSKVESPITLKAFTYKDGDINENGYYRGNYEYEIKVNLK